MAFRLFESTDQHFLFFPAVPAVDMTLRFFQTAGQLPRFKITFVRVSVLLQTTDRVVLLRNGWEDQRISRAKYNYRRHGDDHFLPAPATALFRQEFCRIRQKFLIHADSSFPEIVQLPNS